MMMILRIFRLERKHNFKSTGFSLKHTQLVRCRSLKRYAMLRTSFVQPINADVSLPTVGKCCLVVSEFRSKMCGMERKNYTYNYPSWYVVNEHIQRWSGFWVRLRFQLNTCPPSSEFLSGSSGDFFYEIRCVIMNIYSCWNSCSFLNIEMQCKSAGGGRRNW